MDKTSWTYSKILYIKRKLSLLCQKTFDDLKNQDYFFTVMVKEKTKKGKYGIENIHIFLSGFLNLKYFFKYIFFRF